MGTQDDEEYEEYEQEYDDEDTHVSLLARVLSRPRLTTGGSALLLSLGVDVAARFDPAVTIGGLVAAAVFAALGKDIGDGLREVILPGSNIEEVRASAHRFIDQVTPYEEDDDQSFRAKLGRVFHMGKNQNETEQKSSIRHSPAPRREVERLPPLRPNQSQENGLTYEKIVHWFKTGQIDDAKFLKLFSTLIDDPSFSQICENGENVKRLHRPSEDGENEEKTEAFSPDVSPEIHPVVTAEEELSVLTAYHSILRQKGKVTRGDIQSALNLNNKKQYIVKAVCDKHGIVPTQGQGAKRV